MARACKYGLVRNDVVVECGITATTHVHGWGAMPRGLDIAGTKAVEVEGDYCDRHATTVKNRTTHTAFPIKERNP